MLFMNEYEIDQAVRNTTGVKNDAARFLAAFKDEVNAHSDGWPYWSVAARAAKRLMQLVSSREEATEAQFRAALAPIKSFYTRRGNAAGMKFPEQY
jgi:hypothetical protein